MLKTSLITSPQPKEQLVYPITVPTVFTAVQVNELPETDEVNERFAGFPLQITAETGLPIGIALALIVPDVTALQPLASVTVYEYVPIPVVKVPVPE